MSENQVRETGTENKKQVRKLKTRCYYTDYVNHAIRFFLSTPETLRMEGKRRADIENWVAVQAVFHCLPDNDRQVLEGVFKAHYKVQEGVRIYCDETGADPNRVWVLVTKTSAAIAKRRGLV